MKPRRENGAIFVSPMTSDVSMGSALMNGFLVVGAHIREQIPAERKSPACEKSSGRDPQWGRRGFGQIRKAEAPAAKKQGRRRSITPTALPAPDIEIGLRRPVNCNMPRELTGRCDLLHKQNKKVAASLWGKAGRARSGLGT